VHDTLLGLTADSPRTVLHAGCGLGNSACGLALHVDRVDAVGSPSATNLSEMGLIVREE